jgi:hypothetical protein
MKQRSSQKEKLEKGENGRLSSGSKEAQHRGFVRVYLLFVDSRKSECIWKRQ